MKTIHEDLKQSISTSQIITHFKKRGVELSKSDAERYLNLLYFLAKQVVNKTLFPPKTRHRTNPKSSNHISGLKSKTNNYKTTS
ncbi:hypothetical protein ACFGVS_15235 [Mucilaginibacter sp. AW1-7]|uniref:hypothetical protein n=1 Tax=Mucilaginibacter sp. AW1-7 TaxID=3349874 RepID=UPI003F73C861